MTLDRNINPHAEARIAMLIWGNEYCSQAGGSMDFWDRLSEGRKCQCVKVLDEILAAPRAAMEQQHAAE